MSISRRTVTSIGPLPTIAALVLLNGGAIALTVERVGGGSDGWSGWAEAATLTVLLLCVLTGMRLAIFLLKATSREPSAAERAATTTKRRMPGGTAGYSEASAARNLFLARLSRELRSSVVPMFGWMSQLRAQVAGSRDASAALAALERSARVQLRIVDTLLDVSRLTSDGLRLSTRHFDLSSLVREVVEAHRPAIEERGLCLKVALDERPAIVCADPERIEQVLRHLLSNALRFTPSGGRIAVVLTCGDGEVSLHVNDTGAGMTPDDLIHAFDPFERALPPPDPEPAGLGVSLAVARRLVELQGGALTAHSPGPGRGTSFRALLPSRTEAAHVDPHGGPLPFGGARQAVVGLDRLDGLRVLLIDDEAVVVDSLRVLLEACGADIRVASSAAQARLVFDQWRPDLLLCDIGMPDEDGCQLVSSIRQRVSEAGGNVPAVALTGMHDGDAQPRALAAGFQGFLVKPADARELLSVIRMLCRPRTRQSTPKGW